MARRLPLVAALVLALALGAARARTQAGADPRLTTPAEAFGAAIGDDYFLASYTQLEQYWHTLARESDRVRLVDLGRTSEGRTQWMAVVSSPANLARLEEYRAIAGRLARAEDLDEAEARALARAGRAVVWIDGGLHATEVLGSQQLIETVYRLASAADAETARVLDEVIVLVAHANPDGHELVADWYMREAEPARRTLDDVPELYQRYAGHDNNRDFFLSSQAETINLNRALYQDWFPQIVYDHHQTAPPGTVMFAPPFRGPSNYLFDPLVLDGIERVGAAMHARFAAEAKPGVTTRGGADYSTWWNGGLRTTAYFHNQIGILTETLGGPTPTAVPFVTERQVAGGDLPAPIAPQAWSFRQAIAYSLTANRAVLDFAARNREALLLGVWRMGRNAIDRGSRDTWVLETARATAARPPEAPARRPETRDPRAYVLGAGQADAATAARFLTALLRAGVTVERAVAPFVADGAAYPAGSWVVRTAQAFGPHVLDMFEPQHHPDDAAFPGGSPTPPYDNAGWTLAYQMGVAFDRVLDPFDGLFEPVRGEAAPAPGLVAGGAEAAGFLVSHHPNAAFIAANRVLAAGGDVFWPRAREGAGVMYIPNGPGVPARLAAAAAEFGLAFTAAPAPGGDGLWLRRPRVALWDRYGGSAESGWARWVLEQFEFPFDLVYAPAIARGELAGRYDVLVLPDGALGASGPRLPDPAAVPAAYRDRIGPMSTAGTLRGLRRFVEGGGTIVAIGSSTVVADYFDLPVERLLGVPRGSGFEPLPRAEYYVPGSVLRMAVDPATPLGYGFDDAVDVFFDNSPVFGLGPGAAGARAVGVFGPEPLRSGWAWGVERLAGAAGVVEVPLGRGRVVLFGPGVVHRGQPWGTFRFLFNAVHLAAAEPARPRQAE